MIGRPVSLSSSQNSFDSFRGATSGRADARPISSALRSCFRAVCIRQAMVPVQQS